MAKEHTNLSDFPNVLKPLISSEYPNNDIDLYEGEIVLKCEDKIFNFYGSIIFTWLPSLNIKFFGGINTTDIPILSKPFGDELYVEFTLLDLNFCGRGFIRRFSISKGDKNFYGFLIPPIIIGDSNMKINTVRFEIPNLIDLSGFPVRSGNAAFESRLIFEFDNFNLTIDNIGHDLFKRSLFKEKGGYMLNYTGSLESTNHQLIDFKTSTEILECFTFFLHFINGRRTAPLFRHGTTDNKVFWMDCSPYLVDTYKYVITWPSRHSYDELTKLFNNFWNLWKNEYDKNCIKSILHWYVEANSNSAFVEGSIVLIQNALELLFHWIISEKENYVISNDADNLSASSKIGFLLSRFGINSNIPNEFAELTSYAKKTSISNGPEAFVRIRNCIVHPTKKKRQTLKDVDNKAKYQSLHLGIWYVELCILKYLRFEGIYNNRCKTISFNTVKAEQI